MQIQFERHNLAIVSTNTFGYRIFHLTESIELESKVEGQKLDYRYPFCDVFIMQPKKNKCFIKEKQGKSLWPNEWYYLKDIEASEMK